MVHALSTTKAVTVKPDQTDVAHARKQVQDGDRDALVVLTKTPTGATAAHLYYSNASATQAGIIRGIVSGASSRISVAATGTRPAIVFSQQSVDSASLNYIDFLLPGILALAIMISAVIGLSTVLVAWRTQGVLRRLKLAPMPLWEFLVARVAASLTLALLQVAVLITFGALVFGVSISPRRGRRSGCAGWRALLLVMGFTVGSLVPAGDRRRRHHCDHESDHVPIRYLYPVAAMPAFVQRSRRCCRSTT